MHLSNALHGHPSASYLQPPLCNCCSSLLPPCPPQNQSTQACCSCVGDALVVVYHAPSARSQAPNHQADVPEHSSGSSNGGGFSIDSFRVRHAALCLEHWPCCGTMLNSGALLCSVSSAPEHVAPAAAGGCPPARAADVGHRSRLCRCRSDSSPPRSSPIAASLCRPSTTDDHTHPNPAQHNAARTAQGNLTQRNTRVVIVCTWALTCGK